MLKQTNRSQSFVATSPSDDDYLVDDIQNQIFDSDGGDVVNSDSPKSSGPTRSSSLKIQSNQSHRVTFTDSMRQSSLPSGDSAMDGLSEVDFSWQGSQLSDVMDVDGERVELRKKNQIYPQKQQVMQSNKQFL